MSSRIKPLLLIAAILITALSLANCAKQTQEQNWNDTVQKVSSGVVSIQMDIPFSFDGNWNSGSYATGFVVDKKQGIILTNRHVVSPGPVTARAILINNEEIDLAPLYLDPVHDFGFFKYDPEQVKHLDIHEFALSDSLPAVGQSIRMIGNDAGQKVSILDGTISRVDRDAPNYGKGQYNDFNIFYIQAATSSTGGSSGSPVIDIDGEVVALNAGSQTKSANAFYLPLEKIKLALTQLQMHKNIARGTIKTTLKYTPYAELSRLGLSEQLESKYRNQYPELKGLLVVRHIIPASEAAKNLKVGDILLTMQQEDIVNFSQFESALNSNVGEDIEISVLRQGQKLDLQVKVDDLHSLSPQQMVKFDGSIFHPLSYQQARHFNKPVKGVYVAGVSGAFADAGVPNRSVISEFNGVAIDNLDTFNQQLKTLPSGAKVHLRYFDFSTPNSTNYALVEIRRKWFEHSYCYKSDTVPYWPCETISAPSTAEQDESSQVAQSIADSGNIEDALVNVSFTSPYSIQGRGDSGKKYGTGVIVDVNKGWVVVPRSVVFSMLGDVKITLNNRYEIEGKVEYIHPLHNLALVSFSTKDAANAQMSQVTFIDKPIAVGEPIVQMGLNYDGNVEYRETYADVTEELWLRQFNVPQYVDRNIEVTHLINPNTVIDGILLNGMGQVVALWSVFDASDQEGDNPSASIAGLGAFYVNDMLDKIEGNQPIYSLDIKFTMLAPVHALQMGLDEAWLNEITQNNKQNKLLAIYNVSASSDSAQYVKRGDILLAVNGIPVSSFRQAEQLTQAPEVEITYFSEGKVNKAKIKTNALNGMDIDRVLYWSGLYLHAPHRAAQLQGNVDSTGVYVASYRFGSPAHRYKLYAMQRIVEVDGQTINSLDDFIAAVKDKKHQESVLIKTLDFNNTPSVVTLKVNNHYWPFYELKYRDNDWVKVDHIVTK